MDKRNKDLEILVIGAFDRNNYGDLLFPLIIENQFNKLLPKAQLNYYGLVESNLTKIGGKETKDISAFYRKCDLKGKTKKIVIIAGGETIRVSWRGLYSYLNKWFNLGNKIFARFGRVLKFEWLAKKLIGGKTDLPLTFGKNDFKEVDAVIGNSLGGSGIDKYFFEKNKNSISQLKDIDYLAVRDNRTNEILTQFGISSTIVPDSAILIAKCFPYENLETKISKEILEFSDRGSYIFFQINNSSYLRNKEAVLEELARILQVTDYAICLCPIGKALGHEDHIALSDISKKIRVKNKYFENVSIWETMFLIAKSECYVGTSLHGAITAMSFGIPYVGLNKEIKKLDYYLKTWGVDELNESVDFNDFSKKVEKAVKVKRGLLKSNAQKQMAMVEQSFLHIKALID